MDNLPIGRVTEPHVPEFHPSGDVFDRVRLAGFVFLFGFVEELKHAFRRGRGGLQRVRHLRDLIDGILEQAHIDEKGGDDTGFRDPAVDKQQNAHHRDRHVAEVGYERHERHHQTGQKLRFPGAVEQIPVGPVEILAHFLLGVKRLDDVLSGIRLLDLSVEFAQVILLADKVFLGLSDDEEHQQHAERHGQKGGQRHFPPRDEHRDQHAAQHDDGGNQRAHALVQRLSDGVHVVGHAGEHVSVAARIEISERHVVDLFSDQPAHPFGSLLIDACHQEGLNVIQKKGRAVKDHERDADPADLAHIDGNAEHRHEDLVRNIVDIAGRQHAQHSRRRRKQQRQDNRGILRL